MLKFSALNVLTHAQNGRYVLWDNGDDQRVTNLCKKLIEENENPSIEVIYKKSENIGLNAAPKIVEEFLSDCDFIMSIDEDIMYMPMGFQNVLQESLVQSEKPIGYLACNVFQDGLTNGARPPLENYRREIVANRRYLFGPTGGWASMTRADLYKQVGGYPVHSEKFFGLDGMYSAKLHKIGYYTGLAEDVVCYHATGPHWNSYFSYQQIYHAKWSAYNKSKA